VKVTERSALVRVAASSQQITAHAGLVLVRELAARLGVGALLDRASTSLRRCGPNVRRPSGVSLHPLGPAQAADRRACARRDSPLEYLTRPVTS
jgi:hypothetical protein